MTAPMKMLPRDLLAPTTASRVISRLILTAGSQVGYREGRDSDGDWNNDNAFGKWYGSNGVSWCAQFVSWAAATAGIPTTVIPKHQYTPTGWNWFVAHDRNVSSPRAGDIFYVYGPVSGEKSPRVHHVGIVEKVLSDGRIQTLEGNTSSAGSAQGNGVYRLVRTVSSKLKFARPNYEAAVQSVTKPTPPPASKPTKPPIREGDNMTDYSPQDLEKYAGVGVHGQKLGRSNVTIGQAIDTTRKDAAASRAMLASMSVQVTGLAAAVKALSEQKGVDPEAVIAAVADAAEKALQDVKITLAVEDQATEATQA